MKAGIEIIADGNLFVYIFAVESDYIAKRYLYMFSHMLILFMSFINSLLSVLMMLYNQGQSHLFQTEKVKEERGE